MVDPEAETIGYYDQHTAEFAAQTADLDLEPLYQRFLGYVRPGGRILDAGCGVGRDALAFAERGYEVVAFDASETMVRLARERVRDRAVVHLMRFQDVQWQDEFDGIWTCASLLHVPAASFTAVVTRFVRALRPGSAWYMSFKLGTAERTAAGRLFVDHDEMTLRASLAPTPVNVVETWITSDLRPGRASEQWLNAVIRMAGDVSS